MTLVYLYITTVGWGSTHVDTHCSDGGGIMRACLLSKALGGIPSAVLLGAPVWARGAWEREHPHGIPGVAPAGVASRGLEVGPP